MNKKSKEAEQCVSKEINRKKEKHLIRIMRSVAVILVITLSMSCISSYDYKLDYKVPEAKGESLETINVGYICPDGVAVDVPRMSIWPAVILFIFSKRAPFITSPLLKEDKASQYGIRIEHYDMNLLGHITNILSMYPIFPYINYTNERDIVIHIYKDSSNRRYYDQGFDGRHLALKIGKSSERAINWLPLIPIQLVWSLFGDPNASDKEKKLKEELAPIVYHLLKQQMAKDAIEQSTPANNDNPSTPTSGFTDTVVLKNGDFIENVKATVTIDSLIVTDANGKTTVYKKSQVLTVKKK